MEKSSNILLEVIDEGCVYGNAGFKIPTCGAASPTPFASYIVSNISPIKIFVLKFTSFTGLQTFLRHSSPNSLTFLVAIMVKAFNEKMEEFEMEAEGLLARCILHENDHLDGIVYVDIIEFLRTIYYIF